MFGPIMDLRALMGMGPRVTKHTITSRMMSPFPSYEEMEIKE
jgi:peptide/nickel transport system substrate-binding protein